MEKSGFFTINAGDDIALTELPPDITALVGMEESTKAEDIIPPADLIQLKETIFGTPQGGEGFLCIRLASPGRPPVWTSFHIIKDKDFINIGISKVHFTGSANAGVDSMTGLFDKQTIIEYARKAVNGLPGKSFWFVMLDLDHFKGVNDMFGHMKGDEVIIGAAEIIRSCVGSYGQVGRIGGDEFMAVLDNADANFKIREVLASIRGSIEDKYANYGGELDITASIGAVLCPDHAKTYDEMFMLADKMLYKAKVKGRNRYIIYTPEIHGDMNQSVTMDTLSGQLSSGEEKLTLMSNLMDTFLKKTQKPIYMALEEIIKTYMIDRIAVFYGKQPKSRYGLRRSVSQEGKSLAEEKEFQIPESIIKTLRNKAGHSKFALANIYDLRKDTDSSLIAYMEKMDMRVLAIYFMDDLQKKGYAVYAYDTDSNYRLSESDVNDIIYFSRMLELTSLER